MSVTEETEAKVREDRERAVEYADRVLAGEEPWKDQEADVNDYKEGDEVPAPRNDDVGESGETDDDLVTEVDQDSPAPEPEE